MVCTYCDHETKVINSRLQKRTNTVWRRRTCNACSNTFTSIEHTLYESTWTYQDRASHIMIFQRDLLFLSIYEACRHRKNAVRDATALTDTVLGKLLSLSTQQGVLAREVIVNTVASVLKNFDKAAYVHYTAFHL